MYPIHPGQSHQMSRYQTADAQRAAVKYQLMRIVNHKTGVFRPILASLGKRMVAWGTTLENRYENCADAIGTWTAKRENVVLKHKG